MDNTVNFTQEELQLIYAACMSYGGRLAEIKKIIPHEDDIILDRLADHAKDSWDIAKKVAECIGK